MPLETYISDLLYRYDCVIIPDFGAFLTKRISAQIDAEQSLFFPPKKMLSFNPQIKHNDGLLSNYISEVEKIPYTEALNRIQESVQQFNHKLIEDRSLTFDHVGELQLDDANNITFIPSESVNYLTSSFGLSEFSGSAIARLEHKKTVEHIEDTSGITLTENAKNERNWLKYAAAAVLILGLTGFGALKYYENTISSHNSLVQEAANKTVDLKVQEATFVISNPLPSAVLKLDKQSGDFHIVAGAFRIEANSDKKVEQLKALGYKARTIGVNRYGLHEVVYSSYNTRNEAQLALRDIRNTHNPEAWLLVKSLD